MSWARVECTGGYRYAAPSHGRAVPQLNGMSRLFQAPFSLRQMHTFSACNDHAPAVSDWRNQDFPGGLGTDECMNSCIMVDQRDLGGHLGITTVSVGDEGDDELMASSALQLLIDRVFEVLTCTNQRGVQIMLDALCTRTPPPLTEEAISRAAILHEDDGGRQVPPALWAARTQGKENSPKGIAGGVATSSNRRFMLKLTQRSPAIQDVPGAVETLCVQTLSSKITSVTQSGQVPQVLPQGTVVNTDSSPAPRSPTFSQNPMSVAVAARPPLSYAAALRRRSLLFFLPQCVVPLSLLAINFEFSTAAAKGKRNACGSSSCLGETHPKSKGLSLATSNANAAHDSKSSLHDHLLESMGCVHAGASQSRWNLRREEVTSSGGVAVDSSVLHCVSHLRRHGGKLLKKSSSWAAVAHTAEEGGKVLVGAIVRLLAGTERPLSESQAEYLHRLILHDLWFSANSNYSKSATVAGDGSPSPSETCMTPLVAVFSPSGLLFSSELFTTRLSHEEHVMLAAAAIDRLARYSAPHDVGGYGSGAPAADAIGWISWPMRIGESEGSTPGGDVVDVLLITVGDSLAFCLLLPRRSLLPSMITSTSLQSIEALLESAVATARAKARLSPAANTSPLTAALVFACTHSTSPYTSTFHDALFALTALEDALNETERTSSKASGHLPVGEPLGVAEYVRRLLLRAAAQTEPSSVQGDGCTVTDSVVHTKDAAKNETQGASYHAQRSGVPSVLHKIFSCLPLRHSDPERGLASSRQHYVTAAHQQSSVYMHRLGEEAYRSPPVPAPIRDLTQGRDPYMAALLAMPLEEMLCYVAALITRNELGVLRPSYALGLHSFFFLQRPSATSSAKHQRTACAQVPTPEAPKKKDVLQRRPTPRALFAVSFSRFRLQHSSCAHALLPEEWTNADGAPDGSGGRLTFFEDPFLLLKLNGQGLSLVTGGADGKSADGNRGETPSEGAVKTLSRSPSVDVMLETQVSVVPVWAFLQAAPAEPLTTADDSDAETDTIDSEVVPAPGGFRGIHGCVPPSADEDAQLVTSLYYSYPQRLRRRKETPLSWSTTQPSAHPDLAQDTYLSETSPEPLTHAPPASVTQTGKAKSKNVALTKTWCQVEAVVNVCGDITGARERILTKALQRHALSSSAEEALKNGDCVFGCDNVPRASAGVHADSLPAEWEYAAEAPHKMFDLCREVVWCQEAALALLDGASYLW